MPRPLEQKAYDWLELQAALAGIPPAEYMRQMNKAYCRDHELEQRPPLQVPDRGEYKVQPAWSHSRGKWVCSLQLCQESGFVLARSKSANAERSDPAATAAHAERVSQWRDNRREREQNGEVPEVHWREKYDGSRGGCGFKPRCAPVLTKDSPVVIAARKLLAPRDGTSSREEIEAGRVAAFDHILAHLAKVGDMPRSWEELVASQSSGPGRIGVNNLAWLLDLTEADDGDLDDGAIDVADLEGGVSRAEPIDPVHEFAVVTGSLSKPSSSDDVGSAEGLSESPSAATVARASLPLLSSTRRRRPSPHFRHASCHRRSWRRWRRRRPWRRRRRLRLVPAKALPRGAPQSRSACSQSAADCARARSERSGR